MSFRFDIPPNAQHLTDLRQEVRGFLAEAMRDIPAEEAARSWHSFDPAFSRKVAEKGWIGMTWPKQYGGHGRTVIERYVVIEEFLAAGAPIGAHWTGDRQSGPLLLRYGTEEQKMALLPATASGELFFCIGMSEPDAGSDLANIKTRARKVSDGWCVNGAKIWTSNAHRRNYMILLCRTGSSEERHGGMSQFLVDLKSPGISIRGIRNMANEHHFNEVVFTDCFIPDSALVGVAGEGWKQVNAELGFERSGPERFLTSYILLRELVRQLGPDAPERARIAVGRLLAHLVTLRSMSFSLAAALEAGRDIASEASVVKSMGSEFEQSIPEIARDLVDLQALVPDDEMGRISPAAANDTAQTYASVLHHVMLHAPSFSIYGGTREILRGIIAKTLGLR
ncbi:acyl-CoA dehydrogenase family protein [Xanthobacter sp.]|uniref:acyl-CoA dehydrogenase family protein n=1 Tax=Xanthobacter sp. TaxID=35809 RepID=UPI0035B3D6F5